MKTLNNMKPLFFCCFYLIINWLTNTCSNDGQMVSYVKSYTADSTVFSAIFDSTIHFKNEKNKAWADFRNTLKFKSEDSLLVNVAGSIFVIDSNKTEDLIISIFGKEKSIKLKNGDFDFQESFYFSEIPDSPKIKFHFPKINEKSESEAWIETVDVFKTNK